MPSMKLNHTVLLMVHDWLIMCKQDAPDIGYCSYTWYLPCQICGILPFGSDMFKRNTGQPMPCVIRPRNRMTGMMRRMVSGRRPWLTTQSTKVTLVSKLETQTWSVMRLFRIWLFRYFTSGLNAAAMWHSPHASKGYKDQDTLTYMQYIVPCTLKHKYNHIALT